MDVKLVLERGGKKQVFRLRKAETIVGRRQGCELRIPSETVSRRHCRLTFRDDILRVEDLGSVNGSFINGERVAGAKVVRPGDRLTVGSISFRVQYQLTQAAIDRLLKEEEEEIPTPEVIEVVEPVQQKAPVAPVADEETVDVELAPPEKPKKVAKKPAKKPVKKKPPAPVAETSDDEENPDASLLLGKGGSWELPSGDDIRDILSQIEDEK